MFIRYRMHKTLKSIDHFFKANSDRAISGDDLQPYLDKPAGREILLALEKTGAIKMQAYDNDIRIIFPGSSILYRLERQDIWVNRIGGFISGVVLTLIAQALIQVLL